MLRDSQRCLPTADHGSSGAYFLVDVILARGIFVSVLSVIITVGTSRTRLNYVLGDATTTRLAQVYVTGVIHVLTRLYTRRTTY